MKVVILKRRLMQRFSYAHICSVYGVIRVRIIIPSEVGTIRIILRGILDPLG